MLEIIRRKFFEFIVSDRDLGPKAAPFVRAWCESQRHEMTWIASAVGSFGNALGALIAMRYAPAWSRSYFVLVHLLAALAFISWIAIPAVRRVAVAFWLCIEFGLIGAYAYGIRWCLADQMPMSDLVQLSYVFMGLSLVMTLLNPLSGWIAGVVPLCYWLLGVAAWRQGGFESERWAMILGVFQLIAAIFAFAKANRVRREARAEFERTGLITANARLHSERLEREIAIASTVQDSVAPPPTVVTSGGIETSFFHMRHDALGGDWGTAKVLADGRLVVAIADVTGKGIQAALIVHALQSLWTSAMMRKSFEPETWLYELNETLLQMGAKRPHTMTLVMAVIDGSTCTCWSAAHVPPFLVCSIGGKRKISTLPARGALLGFGKSLDLKPASIVLATAGVTDLVLATDGVFPHASRHRLGEVDSILNSLAARGNDALRDIKVDDDKILAWIKFRPAA